MSDAKRKPRHFPALTVFTRSSRREGKAKIVANLEDRLCSLCKRFMTDILNGVVHKEPAWGRGSQWKDRAVSRFNHQEGRFFSAHPYIKCPICLLFADCLRGEASDRTKAMIAFNRKEKNYHLRATFSVKCGARNEFFEFQVYHDLGALGPCKLAPIDSERTYQFIQDRLLACNNHIGCKRGTSSLPTRVVDVGLSDGSLVVIFESRGAVAPYVALSHCWGGDIISRTKKENLGNRQQNFKISSLARNFKDAIHITRKLGVRYLWIDALCIVQDDEEDWIQEAASMYEIYNNALLVISASNSRHSETGMLFQRSACISRNFSLNAEGFEDLQITHSQSYKKSFDENSALSKRCWALQERVAARAVIHISFSALLWECRTFSQWEDESPQRSHPILKSMHPNLSLIGHTLEDRNIDLWCTIVSIYTSRNLTFRRDKFSAIAGIAKMFEDQGLKKGRYLAGLWEDSIYEHLLWYSRRSASTRAFDLSPSWSWASVDCPVGWFPRNMPDFELIDGESCIFNTEGTDFDETNKAACFQSGRIALTGATAVAHLDDLHRAFCRDIRFPWWIPHQPRFLDDRGKIISDDHFNQWVIFDTSSYSEFTVLRLCSLRFRSGTVKTEDDHSISYYLLLDQIKQDGALPDQFRRIGIMQVPRRWVSESRSATKTVTIL